MAKTKEEKSIENHAYYIAHKEQILANQKGRGVYQHQYYEQNKAIILPRQRITAIAYQQTEAGRQNKLANAQRMREKHPEKYKARSILRNAVRLGQIKKKPCEACGLIEVESHHDDYSKPLEVRWFCHQHHCELEGRWTGNN